MITCSKTPQIPVKITAWIHMTWNILTFQKEKRPISWKQKSVFEKGQFVLRIVNPLHEKCTWPFKKLHGKQKNALRKSANNRSNIKTQMNECIGFWTSKCVKPAQGQKNTSFEPQSAQNLQQKFWTSKCTKHAQGQKKQKKNFRGIVASSQVDCKVFVFFVFSVCPCACLVHFEVQNFCFFVPVQVSCTLKFKSLFFLSLCRFGAILV